MNVVAARYFILSLVFLSAVALISMMGMRVAVASAADTQVTSVSNTTCSFTPDVENIAYQSEALGVSLTAGEASTIYDALFEAGDASVAMNVQTTEGVKNVVVVSSHGAIQMFDANTGDPLPQQMRMIHTC
ncbi:hypothetical protein [Aeromicrobium sp. 179-A 4D2 NHS]|uniref:hypothetical protein n=1 Tax=Aeromicrobium sp. 179-A 4D2 NHS TaxID=3142375 RepID=UPI00399F2E66